MKMYKILWLVIFVLFSFASTAQKNKLIQSRHTSALTYVYEITNSEALKLLKNKRKNVNTTYFHTLIDTYPTDSIYKKELLKGKHYLKTYILENKQVTECVYVPNFDIFVIDNNTDLCLQLYDLQGNIIKNAEIKIGGKKLKFDNRTRCYVEKKSNRKGIVAVKYEGNTAYYDLNKSYNYDPLNKTMVNIFYRSPLKIIWIPLASAISLPADILKTTANSFKYERWSPNGTIYMVEHFFQKLFHPNDYWGHDYKGYLVFNKPKYKPNDTVKMKAFVVDRKGKPIKKDVKVILESNDSKLSNKILTVLKPYRSGAYEYSFFLHDSLKLRLDNSYIVSLENKKGKNYIGSRFFYEDYTLSNTKLELNTVSDRQFRGKTYKFFVKGTDDNDLNLMDARLEISATIKSIIDFQGDKIIISDTLWRINQNLAPAGESEIIIPDSVFPKANIEYNLNVKMLTADNKTFSRTKSITFYDTLEEVQFSLVKDSIKIETYKNGVSIPGNITLSASDNFENKTILGTYKTPSQVPLNVYYSSYTAKYNDVEATYNLRKQSSLIQSYTTRTSDSIFIDISNPRNLKFIYHIYEQNKEKFRGNTTKLVIHNQLKTNKNYYVTLNYLWGGEMKSETYRIPLLQNQLNIKVKQPNIIYPGQKTKVDIFVTDIKGKPVKDVDVTAFSLTKQFNYSVPEVPYLGNQAPDKEAINHFRIKTKKRKNDIQTLNFDRWRTFAGLDSIEYYKFIYPENNLYKTEYISSSKKTQFAPYVIDKNGSFETICVIFVDNKPVYFGWNTTFQSYSFAVDSGFHRVELRTGNKKIIIPRIYFKHQMKTIFSLKGAEMNEPTYQVQKAPSNFTKTEQNKINPYIFTYRNNFGKNIAYIENNNVITMLNPSNNIYNGILTGGPVMGDVELNVMNRYSMDFKHEPYFEYEFSEKLLKMREKKHFPFYYGLQSVKPYISLTDSVITKQFLKNQYDIFLEREKQEKIRYVNPKQTESGFGRICIENVYSTQSNKTETPLNVIVLKNNDADFIRIYQGNTKYIHQLNEGNYDVIFFYSDYYYYKVQTYVKKNATSFLQIKYPIALNKDIYSEKINNIIESNIMFNNSNDHSEKMELNDLKSQFTIQNQYTGNGYIISGRVVDAQYEPIIGATIAAKNTSFETVTDFNGNFSIKIPSGINTITINFIGYETKEINIFENTSLNPVILNESFNMLDEVVVVGYGTVKKFDFAGSIAGRASGISVTPEIANNVRIRENSNVNSNKKPLYIIDGQIYTGDENFLESNEIENVEVLNEVSATEIYGTRAANGVVIITTKNKKFSSSSLNKGADFDENFLQSASSANNLRSNFSDYAFWQPRLTTNAQGKAIFETTFPDDVTNWQTYVLAMNDKKLSGQTTTQTKSYKPLMAQLASPVFLVKNDKANVIGKSLNYLPDKMTITNNFEINGRNIFTKKREISNSIIDTLKITADNDSVELLYSLKKDDGYFDGEKYNIPVFPVGLEETKGNFYVLDKDTIIYPELDKNIHDVQIYADVDELEFLTSDLAKVIGYKYWCNEQIASKLKALLADKLICKYKNKPFKKESEINKLIILLIKNRNDKNLWGWWAESSLVSLPFSIHALEALQIAKKQGYEVNLKIDDLAKKAVMQLEHEKNVQSINLLKVLQSLNMNINYQKYISHFDSIKNLDLDDRLSLMELKQMCGLKINLDTLSTYKQTTMFGNIYYDNLKSKNTNSYCNNKIINTLTVYRILRNINPEDVSLNKIRQYIFETKKNGNWNTYETAKIAETILPDLLKQNKNYVKTTLKVEGTISKNVDKFPYELKLTSDDKIKITKSGNEPMYLTVYQHYWNENPLQKSSDFVITSHFDNQSTTLQQGKNVKLIVDLEVKKNADYVMITVPIPAGCSYAEKSQHFQNEVHREYFKNETNIFCEKLHIGKYTFEINITPRFSGSYTLNPAKAELMYFPIFNANNEIKKVTIE